MAVISNKPFIIIIITNSRKAPTERQMTSFLDLCAVKRGYILLHCVARFLSLGSNYYFLFVYA